MNLVDQYSPYFVYRRLTLAAAIEYFMFHIEYGFYYLLRELRVKYPEIDAGGVTFGPQLSFKAVRRSTNTYFQDAPIPFNLLTTPGSSAVQVNAASQMTATPPKNNKVLNILFPYRDNIELQVSGQNGTTPTICDIVLVGYLIPFEQLKMWGKNGSKD